MAFHRCVKRWPAPSLPGGAGRSLGSSVRRGAGNLPAGRGLSKSRGVAGACGPGKAKIQASPPGENRAGFVIRGRTANGSPLRPRGVYHGLGKTRWLRWVFLNRRPPTHREWTPSYANGDGEREPRAKPQSREAGPNGPDYLKPNGGRLCPPATFVISPLLPPSGPALAPLRVRNSEPV